MDECRLLMNLSFQNYLLLFLLIVLLYKPKEAKWLAKINLPIR